MQATNVMEKRIFAGTAEELAHNDELMAELHRLDRMRTDLEEYTHHELVAYISCQNTTAYIATQKAGAATTELMKRLTPAGDCSAELIEGTPGEIQEEEKAGTP